MKDFIHGIKYGAVITLLLSLIAVSSVFSQEIILDPPVIDSISVDTLPNGQYRCVLGWEPYDWTGFDPDSSGFIVRDVHPISGYSNPDTIFNAFATFYFDSTSNPIEEIQGYGLDVFTYKNGVWIDSEIADQHSQNMQVAVTEYNSCKTETLLEWNTYYDDEVSSTLEPSYQVFAYSATDSRSAIINTNQYVYSGLNKNENYTFKVRALGNDFTSTSTPSSYFTYKPANPDLAQFKSLETDINFSNTLSIDVDDTLTGRLIVYKSTDPDFQFDTFQVIAQISDNIEVVDEVGSSIVAYYYMETNDLCLDEKLLTDTINSILLSARDRTGYIELRANGYQFGEANYYLKRMADGQESIINESSFPIQYNDFEILNQPLSNPDVIYQVVSATNDSIQIASNPARVVIKDDLKWPNAIIAGEIGVDGIFRPVIEKSVPEKYNLKIFSKWGQLLFESNNIERGWNGMYKGQYVLPGGYLFVATYKWQKSGEKVKKGTVTIIH